MVGVVDLNGPVNIASITVEDGVLNVAPTTATLHNRMKVGDVTYAIGGGSTFDVSGQLTQTGGQRNLTLRGGTMRVFEGAEIANQDIGGVSAAGSYSEAGGVHTVTGSGGDIWGGADEFHFVYLDEKKAGDFSVVARVSDPDQTDVWAKAGIMIRESLTGPSKNAFVARTPTGGENRITFQRRTTDGTNAASEHTNGFTQAYYWVKLERTGNTFSGWWADDLGGTPGVWAQMGSNQTFTMDPAAYLGLAVTAHSNGALSTAEFDNVSFFAADAPLVLPNSHFTVTADSTLAPDTTQAVTLGNLVLQNDSTLTLAPGPSSISFGDVSGGGTVGGTATVRGELAPGASTDRLTFLGDLTLAPTAGLVMEIAGLAPGTEHDQVVVSGSAALNDALLVLLADPDAINVNDEFTLMVTGGLQGLLRDETAGLLGDGGLFSTDAGIYRLDWQINYPGMTDVLVTLTGKEETREIPEPATMALLACGVLGMAGYLRKRRRIG